MVKHKWILASVLVFSAGLAAQQQKESLLIGPGDALNVQVFDTPELTQTLRVTDSGEVSLMVGGDVKVGGLTPGQAAGAIKARLQDGHYMRNPQVLVTVSEYATEKVSILGEVKMPGSFPLRTSRSVVDVLSLAGGLTELADRKILIQRNGSSEKVPYFFSNQADTALDTAVQVNPGDAIIVPRAGIAFALGDVHVPGGYTMTNNESQLTLLQLVARAGGVQHTAAAPHAKLIRKTKQGYVEIAIDLRDMLNGKRPDMLLVPEDVLYVPFSYARNLAINSAAILATAGNAAVYRF